MRGNWKFKVSKQEIIELQRTQGDNSKRYYQDFAQQADMEIKNILVGRMHDDPNPSYVLELLENTCPKYIRELISQKYCKKMQQTYGHYVQIFSLCVELCLYIVQMPEEFLLASGVLKQFSKLFQHEYFKDT